MPFYHPKVLEQYLLSNQAEKVRLILKHLLDFLEKVAERHANGASKTISEVPRMRLATLMVAAKRSSSSMTTSLVGNRSTVQEQQWRPRNTAANSNTNSSNLATTNAVDDDRYSFLNNTASAASSLFSLERGSDDHSVIVGSNSSASDTDDSQDGQTFGPQHARRLSELLTFLELPDVSSQDQLHLLAVIDTFAQIQVTGVDACGLRYLLSYKVCPLSLCPHIAIYRCPTSLVRGP